MVVASGEPEPKLDPAVPWIPGGHSSREQELESDSHPMLPLNPPATAAPGVYAVQHKRWILLSTERSRKGYLLPPRCHPWCSHRLIAPV